MSKADKVREYALSLVGQDYSLGNEPWYDVGWEPDPDPLATDCSGLVYGCFRRAGVLLNNKAFPRLTAHAYYLKSNRIQKPTKCGDLGFLMNSQGHVYHTFLFTGSEELGIDEVVEAGWKGKVRKTTIAVENTRGAIWGRLDTDIGDLTGEDMQEDIKQILQLVKELKVSSVAHSNDTEAVIAKLDDDIDQMEDLLEEANTAAIEKKQQLGMM